MKNIIKIMLLTLLMNTSVYANPLLVQGVSFPQGPISFADEVVEYRVGNGSKAPFDKPNAVIALPNGNVCEANKCPSFSLGKHGFITIKFNDNYLTTSGDSSDDLWIFEVGEVVESTAVEISKDGKQWISVGKVEGATSGIDIDAYKANGVIDDTRRGVCFPTIHEHRHIIYASVDGFRIKIAGKGWQHKSFDNIRRNA